MPVLGLGPATEREDADVVGVTVVGAAAVAVIEFVAAATAPLATSPANDAPMPTMPPTADANTEAVIKDATAQVKKPWAVSRK